MPFVVIDPTEVDAKSPIDDSLMTTIKEDLDFLNTATVAAGAKPFLFEVNGRLKYINEYRRSVAFGIVNDAFIPTQCRWLLKKSGLSGTLAFDLRRHTMPKTPITEIAHQYSAATSSIAQQGSAINTQSIARATTQIATQSITHAKSAINTNSIILLGTVDDVGVNLVQYNLASSLDADNAIGDSLVMASHSAGGNNGTFVIVEINRGGGNNVVISNASGVAQTGAAGNIQPKIMSYNFTNPVNSNFSATRSHIFATHTTGANNGTLQIYAINQSGNNIWVKNATGVVQAGVAGTVDSNHWIFAFLGAASTTDYIVGEFAKTAAHTSGLNNVGALEIIAVNSGGNNVVLYNSVGVAQAGVLGNVNTNRWRYNLPSDPSAQVTAGDTMVMDTHTTPANNGTFTIKEVTSAAVIVYNTAGVLQAGAAGSVYTTKKLVKFISDQSAVYTTDSWIEMQGCVSSLYNYNYARAPFKVLQVNRGGGANYNVVIDNATIIAQASPAGYVQVEMKSIFSSSPSIAVDLTGLEPNQNISGVSTSLIATTIAASTPVMLYLNSFPTGDPRDLTVLLV